MDGADRVAQAGAVPVLSPGRAMAERVGRRGLLRSLADPALAVVVYPVAVIASGTVH